MNRFNKIKVILCVVIAALGLILGACSHDGGYERLATPQNLRVEDGALVWDAVKHAIGYAVYIDDEENLTADPQFDLSGLTEKNTTYELFVIAVGDGKHYDDSDEAKYVYTYTGPEVVPTPNLAYTLLPDGSGYEVSRGKANLKGRIVIPDYYEGLPVKKIANMGFGIEGLNSPTNSLTTGVRLPETLEEIGYKAFINCVALTEMEIPESVLEIGEYAFSDCDALKKVKLPAALYELSSHVFDSCSKLEDMPLPSGLKKIGDYSLCYTDLSVIDIPDGVTEIGAWAFSTCPIANITIPDSVTTIGAGAFSGIKNITEIAIHDGVTRLENYLLSGCSSLADIRFPEKIEYFGCGVVRGTKWLKDQPEGIVTVQGYMCGYNGSIPDGTELIISTEVKHISGDVFRDLSAEDITLTIPDGITIGASAFASFQGLKSIRLPADLVCIADHAFSKATSIESIYIPDGVTEIGKYAFFSCTALKSIHIPDGVIEIGKYAFYNCSALSSLELPSGLKKIGDDAFGYKDWGVLRMPESVTQLGDMRNSHTKKIIMSPSLAATVPRLPLNVHIRVYITCTPEENEYDYEEMFKGQKTAHITFYLYVEDEQDLPDDGGNYWHYDDDGKTPVIWQE